MGAEAVGGSVDGRAAPAASARGGGLCSVLRWVFKGMGGSRVTRWRVGSVERTRGWGRERLGRVPVGTGTGRGTSVTVFWKTAGRNFDCAALVRRLWWCVGLPRSGWVGHREGSAADFGWREAGVV